MTAKVKESPHLQYDEVSDTIKGSNNSVKKGKHSLKKPHKTNMLDRQSDKSFGGCVQMEGSIVLS